MGVKEGYKNTAIGVIPEDWNVIKFGKIVDYRKGFAFKANDYIKSGIRIIRVSDTTYDSIKQEGGVYLNEKHAYKYKKWALRENDLLFTTVGSKPPMYDSMVGKVIMISKKHNGNLLNQNAVLIRSKSNNSSLQSLLLSNFRTNRYLNYIKDIFRGNANQASITLNELFEYQIPLPSTMEEQQAIATVLSDTDKLIQTLSKQIAKKRLIKQGAMQKLLTPKEGWEVCTLNNAVDFLDNLRKPIKSSERTALRGGYPYYGASGIIDYVNDYIFDDELILLGEDGENILSRNLPLAFKIKGKVWVNNHAHVLKTRANFNIDYLVAYLESLDYSLLNSGTAQPKLNKQSCLNIKINHPSLKEQTRIATILSDMDTEIETLENKLLKYKQLKQGLMQNLLTGKIRLL